MSKIENKVLSDLVYDKLKHLIDDGVLATGRKINKIELAGMLGVSQTPINDALSRLTGERLIEQRSRQGYFVRSYSWQELMPIYELRAGLEGMAIRLCVEKHTPLDMPQLVHAFDAFALPVPEERRAEYMQADKLFHESIIRYSGNLFLLELVQTSAFLIKSNLRGLVRVPDETLPEHHAILEAVLNREAAAAQERVILHLLRSRDRLKTLKD
jgi:DNA-binding GntR family transcriptional regulator